MGSACNRLLLHYYFEPERNSERDKVGYSKKERKRNSWDFSSGQASVLRTRPDIQLQDAVDGTGFVLLWPEGTS